MENDQVKNAQAKAEELFRSVQAATGSKTPAEADQSPEQQAVEKAEEIVRAPVKIVAKEVSRKTKEVLKNRLLQRAELPYSPNRNIFRAKNPAQENPNAAAPERAAPGAVAQHKIVSPAGGTQNSKEHTIGSQQTIPAPKSEFSARETTAESKQIPEQAARTTILAQDAKFVDVEPKEKDENRQPVKRESAPALHDLNFRKEDNALHTKDENPRLSVKEDGLSVHVDDLMIEDSKIQSADTYQKALHRDEPARPYIRQSEDLPTLRSEEQLHLKQEDPFQETNVNPSSERTLTVPLENGRSGGSDAIASEGSNISFSDNSSKITEIRAKNSRSDGDRALERPFDPNTEKNNINIKKTDDSLKVRSSTKIPLQTEKNVTPIQTLERNQALAATENALHTADSINAGQSAATMAASAGGAVGEAASGAATGGATVAVKVGKKILDKLRDEFLEISQRERGSKRSSGSAGGILMAALVILTIPVICLAAVASSSKATNVNLSDDVLSLMTLIQAACDENGIPEYAPLVAAVMMQESGGHADNVGGDVMQCAEAMGYPVGTPVPVEESINYGTRLIANYLAQAGCTGVSDIPAISLALQSYNYGGGYLTWAQARGGYTKENALEFANQQAALLGWSSYGDPEYVDHVLRYYQVVNGMGATMGDTGIIADGRYSYPLAGHYWTTYAGHEGIDIPIEEGTPVYAAATGTVIYAQNNWTSSMGYSGVASYGNCVFIDDGGGWQTRYAHLSSVVVQFGDVVTQGQLIGYSGNTGNSTGPHLHLAIYYNGSPSSGGVIYAEQAWPQYKGG